MPDKRQIIQQARAQIVSLSGGRPLDQIPADVLSKITQIKKNIERLERGN